MKQQSNTQSVTISMNVEELAAAVCERSRTYITNLVIETVNRLLHAQQEKHKAASTFDDAAMLDEAVANVASTVALMAAGAQSDPIESAPAPEHTPG